MSALALSSNSWAEWERDEARFQRTLTIVAFPFLLLCILIPLWELTGLQEGGGEQLSERYAQLLQSAAKQEQPEAIPAPAVEEPADEPEPEPEAEPVAEPEPAPEAPPTKAEPKPEPVVDQRAQARENVRRKFAAQFNALDDLRDPTLTANNSPLKRASNAQEAPSDPTSGVLTSNLGRGSGGVATPTRRDSTSGTTGLSGRQSTQVDTEIVASGGYGAPSDRAGFGGDSRLQGRSLEEIQIVMDRNKGGLYSLYNRALRGDATLQGKVVLEITIAPSGAVTQCEIISSELRNPELEERIVRRVQLIDFGPKDVSAITIKYPIHFIPS